MNDNPTLVEPAIGLYDHPDHPGWQHWKLRDDHAHRFNGSFAPMLVRKEGESLGRVRMFPRDSHSNIANNLHGGALLAFLDMAMFGGARIIGITAATSAVTADIQVQFVSAGRIDRAVDAMVELIRETRSLIFVRGLVVQSDDNGGETTIASYTGLLKKLHQK